MRSRTTPNCLLRKARERKLSPSSSCEPLSARELAEAINEYLYHKYGKRTPLDDKAVMRFERGVVRWPGALYREGFRAILGAATDAELGFYIMRTRVDAGHIEPSVEDGLPPIALVRTHAERTDGGSQTKDLLLRHADDAGLDSRLARYELPGASTWEEIVAQQSMDFVTRARRSAMDPTALEHLEAQLRQISREYLHSPDPRAHFSELVVIRDRAFRQIESERPRPDQSRQLHGLAGIACALLAQSTHEMGFRRAAMSHAHAAFVCAELAGFDSLQVWIRATQAAITEYAGLPMETIRYAEAGRAHTSRGTAVVRLMSLAANGHARMGDLDAARAALAAADHARDTAAEDDALDDFGGVFSVSLAKQHAYAASALALLGQGPAATAAASRALELYRAAPLERRQPVNEAYAHIDIAFGRLLSGEFDGIGDALAPVLALPVHARVDLLDENLRRMHRQLAACAPGDQPRAIRDIQGRIEEFVATVGTPALP